MTSSGSLPDDVFGGYGPDRSASAPDLRLHVQGARTTTRPIGARSTGSASLFPALPLTARANRRFLTEAVTRVAIAPGFMEASVAGASLGGRLSLSVVGAWFSADWLPPMVVQPPVVVPIDVACDGQFDASQDLTRPCFLDQLDLVQADRRFHQVGLIR